MLRYHLFPFIKYEGIRYRMLAHRNHQMRYFEDQTLMGEILEVLERPWYRKLIRSPYFSWEIDATYNKIVYYYWAPDKFIGDEIRRKILGMHPDMEITPVVDLEEDPDIDFKNKYKYISASTLKMDRDFVVPIKSFFNEIVDSQAAIVNSVSDLEENERCVIQVLIKPAELDFYQKRFDKAEKIVNGWINEEESEKKALFETNIAGKQTKQLAYCVIRIQSGSYKKSNAKRILAEVQRSFGQFKSEALNSFVPRERWMHVPSMLTYDMKHRLYPISENKDRRCILNIEEMSGITRLPSEKVNITKLHRLNMKTIEAPRGVLNISNEVKTNGKGKRYIHIGHNTFRMKQNEIYLDLESLRQHMLVLGGSGSGKSVFLENLIINICNLKKNGLESGFFLIDPLGGLAQTVISNMPDELYDVVNYVQPDPLAKNHFPFNIFDVDFGSTEHSIAKNISDAIGRIWKDGWGVRPAKNFLFGGIALQRLKLANIINLEKLLRDSNFANDVFEELQHDKYLQETGVLDEILKWARLGGNGAKPQEQRQKMELTESTLNKLAHFTLSSLMRKSMGSKSNGFRWLESMNNGQINILDLSKIQNEEEKRMYGSLALTMNYQAAILRETHADNSLYPIFVDEFPMLISSNVDVVNDMADRTRQKNVPIIGAAQGIVTQLDQKVADAISRNFNTQIAFRVNDKDDAEWVEDLFNDPKVDYSDYQRTPENYAYARINLGRSSSLPFSVLTNPPKYKRVDDTVVQKYIDKSILKAMEREKKLADKFDDGKTIDIEISKDFSDESIDYEDNDFEIQIDGEMIDTSNEETAAEEVQNEYEILEEEPIEIMINDKAFEEDGKREESEISNEETATEEVQYKPEIAEEEIIDIVINDKAFEDDGKREESEISNEETATEEEGQYKPEIAEEDIIEIKINDKAFEDDGTGEESETSNEETATEEEVQNESNHPEEELVICFNDEAFDEPIESDHTNSRKDQDDK